jgi:hypothetical protein
VGYISADENMFVLLEPGGEELSRMSIYCAEFFVSITLNQHAIHWSVALRFKSFGI